MRNEFKHMTLQDLKDYQNMVETSIYDFPLPASGIMTEYRAKQFNDFVDRQLAILNRIQDEIDRRTTKKPK